MKPAHSPTINRIHDRRNEVTLSGVQKSLKQMELVFEICNNKGRFYPERHC